MDFYLVRSGAMRNLAVFQYEDGILIPSQKVIIRTERGLELGTVVNRAKVNEQEPKTQKLDSILRKVTPEDRKRLDEIDDDLAPKELRYAREKVTELKLPMKIIYVEHLFAGNRIVFYFLSNGRVDFRKLVKELARNYQTRIELKQIGVRDEARLLSDYEHCGRELCCRAWIKKLQPVTMKLAKNQKATLDPTKISGGCGRLMCCLRYEDKTYEELRKNLPRRKSHVHTAEGDGEVIDFDVLTQTVVLRDASGKRFMVAAEDIQGPASPTRKSTTPQGRRPNSKVSPRACPNAKGNAPCAKSCPAENRKSANTTRNANEEKQTSKEEKGTETDQSSKPSSNRNRSGRRSGRSRSRSNRSNRNKGRGSGSQEQKGGNRQSNPNKKASGQGASASSPKKPRQGGQKPRQGGQKTRQGGQKPARKDQSS